jgi:hypothetical protein
VIECTQSQRRPHIIKAEGSYKNENGKTVSAFHPGQIWVRVGSQNRPATYAEIEDILRARLSGVISSLSNFLADLAKPDQIQLVLSGTGIAIRPDPSFYPYFATDIAEKLKKEVGLKNVTPSKVGKVSKELKINESSAYTFIDCYPCGTKFKKYSESAYEKIKEHFLSK